MYKVLLICIKIDFELCICSFQCVRKEHSIELYCVKMNYNFNRSIKQERAGFRVSGF